MELPLPSPSPLSLPVVIDSSQIVTFRTCPQRYYNQYVLGLAPEGDNVHLHFGATFANALETARKAFFLDAKSEKDSLAAGLASLINTWGNASFDNETKTLFTACRAFEAYLSHYRLPFSPAPITLESGSAIEFSFAIPLPILHPSGEPFILAGRFDWIGDFYGTLAGYDEKTMARMDSGWSDKFRTRNQFISYLWAARQLGYPIDKMIVRGVQILKTDIRFGEAIIHYNPVLEARWFAQLTRDLERMKQMANTGIWDYDLGDGCTSYNRLCPFQDLCLTNQPELLHPAYGKTEFRYT